MATLTPAELATLLGPQSANEITIAPAPIADSNRWNGFAERIAKSLTVRLRPLVRAAARVKPNGAIPLKAETIQAAGGEQVISEVWQTSQSDEPSVVTLSLPLVAAFVDRLLGGGSGPIAVESRSFSDTDRQLASRLIDAIRQSVVEAVPSTSTAESCRLDRLATVLTEAWLPDCELVRLTFDVRFVQGAGSFDLLLPVDFAETLADKLPQSHEPGLACRTSTDRGNVARVAVRLAQTSLPASDLNNLAIGDVLLTEVEAGQPCEVLIDGRLAFLAEPGQLDGHKATRLLQAIT